MGEISPINKQSWENQIVRDKKYDWFSHCAQKSTQNELKTSIRCDYIKHVKENTGNRLANIGIQ